MRPPRPLKRHCLIAAAMLCLGLLSTILIAWTCALLVHVPGDIYAVTPARPLRARAENGWRMLRPSEYSAAGYTDRALSLTRYNRFGSTYVLVNLLTLAGTGDRENMEHRFRAPEAVAGPLLQRAVLPWVFALRDWPPGDEYAYFSLRGWPLRALWLEYSIDYSRNSLTGDALVHGGFRIKLNDPTSVWYAPPPSPTALPIRPLWIGLAVDTLFFAAIWSLLIGGLPRLRRALRRRRGRCPACGYDLRSLLPNARCPECGTPAREIVVQELAQRRL